MQGRSGLVYSALLISLLTNRISVPIIPVMKLEDWLSTRTPKMTQATFGVKVGLSQGRISQIVKNGTSDLSTAIRIQDATGGDVTLRDLLMGARGEDAEAA